jgi:hypothetical protein
MILYDDNSKALKRALFATMAIERPGLTDDSWGSCFVPTQPWTTVAVLTAEPTAKAVKRPSTRRMSPTPIVVSADRKARVFRWKPNFRWRNKRNR